jgi:hypothetical protein
VCVCVCVLTPQLWSIRVSGWEGRGGLDGWFKSWSFLRFRNAKGFLFCFLTWVGRLGLGGLCLFQCLAVLDFSDESWVLCYFAFTSVCMCVCARRRVQWRWVPSTPKWESPWEVQVSIMFEYFFRLSCKYYTWSKLGPNILLENFQNVNIKNEHTFFI